MTSAISMSQDDEHDSLFFEELSHLRTEDLQCSSNAEVILLRSIIESSSAQLSSGNEDQLALEAIAAACGEFNQYQQQQGPSPITATFYNETVTREWPREEQHHNSPPMTISRIAPSAPRPGRPVARHAATIVDAASEDEEDGAYTRTPTARGTKVSKRKGTSTSTKNKRQRRRNEDDNWTNSTVDDSDDDTNSNKAEFPASVHGETRLNIKFLNLGTLGNVPQRFGKNRCLIPDGLEGVHQMYEQRWKFGIRHVRQGNGMVFIEWTIYNLATGHRTSIMETMQDALNREGCGRTICNNVLKSALEARALQIENEARIMRARGDANRAINHETHVKNLRPKRCTVGLLFFGLLHEQVQTLMRKEDEARRG